MTHRAGADSGFSEAEFFPGLASFLLWAIVPLAVVAVVMLMFSSRSTRYRCVGTPLSDGSHTLFMELEEYRWWVGLWSDSDGMLRYEIPTRFTDHYGLLDESGDMIRIYDRPLEGETKELAGTFSKMSESLSVATPWGRFEGECIRVRVE